MAEETIIIRVAFPYLDERLYPTGWRSFSNEIIGLNIYDLQFEFIGLNNIVGELINEIVSVNDIIPGVFNTIRSLNVLEMIQEVISLNSFPEPNQKEVISLNILAEEYFVDCISHNSIQGYNGPYTSGISALNRLEDDPSFEELTHSAYIFVSGSSVTDNIERWEISIDDESYVNSATIYFLDKSNFSNCDPLLNIGEKRLKITLDGDDYEFLLERRSLSRDPKSGNFSIWGRSYVALLDVPYAIPITDKDVVEEDGSWYCPDDDSYVPHIWQTEDRLASEIMENVIGDFNLVMEIDDFIVKKDVFVVSNETPIEIVNNLASVVGAYVRTDFNDNVIVRYRDYNVTGTSQATFTDLENILLLNEGVSFPQGYNKILIRGPVDPLTDQSIGLDIVLDDVLNNDKNEFEFGDDIWFRVYKSPFTVTYSIESSLGSVSLTNSDAQDIISRESSGFDGKTLQTDRPINSITSIERYDCSDLGASDYSFEQGYKIVTSESAIEDEPVLISYISKYDLYKLVVNQPCDPLDFDEVISRIVVEQT